MWECQLWKRHQIVKRITQHVLSKHLSLSNDDVVQIVDQLDFSLLHGANGNPFVFSLIMILIHLTTRLLYCAYFIQQADPISFSGSLTGTFEILSKRLRQLDGLPLKISSVQPLDPGAPFIVDCRLHYHF